MVTVTAPDAPPHTPRSGGGAGSRRRWRVVGLLLGVLLAGTAYAVWSAPGDDPAPAYPTAEPDWTRPPVSRAELPGRLGVRLTQVAVSGGGGLLDVRFQVVDPDKAAAIHDARTPPALVAEDSELFLDNLLMGHSHSGAYKTAVTYYLLFENEGNLVLPGSRVSVLLGDVEIQHVVVR